MKIFSMLSHLVVMKRFGTKLTLTFIVVLNFGCAADKVAKVETQPTNEGRPANNAAMMISADGVDASEPAIASAADGKMFVAYVQKAGENGSDLFVRSFDAKSHSLSTPVRVNPIAGQVRTWYGDPPTIAVAADGSVYIGWTAKYPDGAKGTLLYLSVSHDGGVNYGEPVQVNDDKEPASHGMHSLAIGKDGQVYVAWLDERYLHEKSHDEHARSGFAFPFLAVFHHTPTPAPMAESEPNAELYFAVSKDGGKSFSANKLIGKDVCPCCKSSIAVAKDGQVFVGYRKVFTGSMRHIAVSSSRDQGANFGEPVQVSDDKWQIEACPVSGPALHADGDSIIVAWFSGGDAGPHGIYISQTPIGGDPKFSKGKLIEEMNASGSPAWAGNQLFWNVEGKVRSAPISGDQIPPAVELADGKNVAAAVGPDGKAHYAFVSTSGDNKSVWVGSR